MKLYSTCSILQINPVELPGDVEPYTKISDRWKILYHFINRQLTDWSRRIGNLITGYRGPKVIWPGNRFNSQAVILAPKESRKNAVFFFCHDKSTQKFS